MKKATEDTSVTMIAATVAPIHTVGDMLRGAQRLMTRKNLVTVIHWVAIGSAAVTAFGTEFVIPANEKVAGYGVVVMILTVSSVLNKFAGMLDDKATLAQAVAATLPLIRASTAGSSEQADAVHAEVR
jgi:hypothetical protein